MLIQILPFLLITPNHIHGFYSGKNPVILFCVYTRVKKIIYIPLLFATYTQQKAHKGYNMSQIYTRVR